MSAEFGERLRKAINAQTILPLIGVYDVYSASLAGRCFDGIFVSGFGFSASHYGLPDTGMIAWSDLLGLVQRLRAILRDHHILVDIDDGFGEPALAAHVVRQLQLIGASGVVLEDQRRPRRCGHLDGKQLLPLEDYLLRLDAVLAARDDLLVVARTDAVEPQEAIRRAHTYAGAGADAVLVEAVRDLSLLKRLHAELPCPLVFNQIAGGKSPPASLTELRAAGVSVVNYSTPCLFAAHDAIVETLSRLQQDDGRLPAADGERIDVQSCSVGLEANREGLSRPG